MKILAIDYGARRIGLAMGDDSLRIALPYGVVEVTSDEMAIEKIADLVIKENFSLLIIGLPISLDGGEGTNAVRVRKFGDQLVAKGFEIKYIDERFTSREADRMCLPPLRRSRSSGETGGGVSRDEKAAMLILDSYFGGK